MLLICPDGSLSLYPIHQNPGDHFKTLQQLWKIIYDVNDISITMYTIFFYILNVYEKKKCVNNENKITYFIIG